jgi:hypothetical protein
MLNVCQFFNLKKLRMSSATGLQRQPVLNSADAAESAISANNRVMITPIFSIFTGLMKNELLTNQKPIYVHQVS